MELAAGLETPAAALPRVRTPGQPAATAVADITTPLLANSTAAVLQMSEAWRDETGSTQARLFFIVNYADLDFVPVWQLRHSWLRSSGGIQLPLAAVPAAPAAAAAVPDSPEGLSPIPARQLFQGDEEQPLLYDLAAADGAAHLQQYLRRVGGSRSPNALGTPGASAAPRRMGMTSSSTRAALSKLQAGSGLGTIMDAHKLRTAVAVASPAVRAQRSTLKPVTLNASAADVKPAAAQDKGTHSSNSSSSIWQQANLAGYGLTPSPLAGYTSSRLVISNNLPAGQTPSSAVVKTNGRETPAVMTALPASAGPLPSMVALCKDAAEQGPFPMSPLGFVSSSTSLKASEPAFEHQDDDGGCAFQTKIFEVLDMKKEGTQKLWVSNECMVLDAVKKMAQNDVGSLLVYDKKRVGADGKVPTSVEACVGIITERDYLKKVVVKGLTSATTPVSVIMTPSEQLAVLTPEHSVLEAMDLMVKYNVRHVPVMDRKAMAGVLSMKDVVKVLLDDQKHEIDSLKDYIHGGW
eukprot:gene13612-13737_t